MAHAPQVGHPCFREFKQLSSTIDWRVVELKRLGQYGEIMPFDAKLGWLERC